MSACSECEERGEHHGRKGRGAQKDKMSPRRTEGQNESASVWQGFCVAQHGRQVHLGQTKAVKGQDSKILVTAGTIKRPLPCPVKGIEKQRIYLIR